VYEAQRLHSQTSDDVSNARLADEEREPLSKQRMPVRPMMSACVRTLRGLPSLELNKA
jgi:hypothetical protein